MCELDYKVNMTLTVTQKYKSTKRNKITHEILKILKI